MKIVVFRTNRLGHYEYCADCTDFPDNSNPPVGYGDTIYNAIGNLFQMLYVREYKTPGIYFIYLKESNSRLIIEEVKEIVKCDGEVICTERWINQFTYKIRNKTCSQSSILV